jgi:Putative transposase/Transposase zinc-binding domain
MGLLHELFCSYGPQYLERFGQTMPHAHKKVIAAIMRCRTESNGSVFYQCTACGAHHIVARSCGNRHCPGCQHHKSRQWLQRQLERQVPGHHFMLTFTVPEPLRPFLRRHQRIGYEALFAASVGAIKKLAADEKYIGADTPGFFGVLHTWGRQLHYHPHIHYLVPGGALSSADGQWHPSSPGFYLPVRALSRIFRAKFRDEIAKEDLLGEIPAEVWGIDWNVNCQALGNGAASLRYLSRYVFKVAISEHRIIRVDEQHVFFRYRRPHSNRVRTMALPIMEFMRRFLQHVLPSGFMKVRYYGFLSPSFSVPIEEVKARIKMAHGFALRAAEVEIEAPAPMRCPRCGGVLQYRRTILPPAYSLSGAMGLRRDRVAEPAIMGSVASGP